MTTRALLVIGLYCLVAGCVGPKAKAIPVIQVTPPFQQYLATNIQWPSIRRIVLLPLANETEFAMVSDQIRSNLVTEIQRAGRFEIVSADHEDALVRARDVFSSGQFDELEVLRVAREYQADAVLFANVTQYSPYSLPKLGMSLLMVNPAEGVAIASIRGVWDMREVNTATHAQTYLKKTQSWPRSLMGSERVFESPDVFQRYVCNQIAVALYPSAAVGSTTSYVPQPPDVIVPTAQAIPAATEIPTLPPPAMHQIPSP